jgi:hypothetical protein
MRKLLFLFLLCAFPCFAQTTNVPKPISSTKGFSLGAAAFGVGGMAQATPASDVTLTLKPGFATTGYLSEISLRSDSLLAPGANLQFYGGGLQAPIPLGFAKESALGPLSFYADATFGVDRIVPSTGPSAAHFAFMAGGGVNWTMSSGVTVNLIEVNDLHAPGAAWGNDAPAVSGGISYVWGK